MVGRDTAKITRTKSLAEEAALGVLNAFGWRYGEECLELAKFTYLPPAVALTAARDTVRNAECATEGGGHYVRTLMTSRRIDSRLGT